MTPKKGATNSVPLSYLNVVVKGHEDDETNSQSIQEAVDCAVASFKQGTWASSLMFHGSVIPVTETYCQALHGPHMSCNIMDYTNSIVYSSSKFVFDATQYPCPPCPSPSNAFPRTPFSDSPGWSNLKSDIQKAAINNGFVLFSNGGAKGNIKRFCCKHNGVYRKNQLLINTAGVGKNQVSARNAPVVYRKSTLTNDRRNSRGPAGLKLPKRTTTARPLKKADKCSFNLTISTDGSNFFMKGGIGSSLHCGHPQLNPEQLLMSSCVLKSAEREDIRCMAAAHASPAVARNFLMKKTMRSVVAGSTPLSTSTILSRRQIAYVQGMSRITNKKSGDKIIGQESSTSDQMFEYLQSLPGASYCCLYHHACSNEIPQPMIASTTLSPSKLVNEVVRHNSKQTEEMELKTKDNPDLAQYAEMHRKSLDLCSTQELMIASAWVLAPETRLAYQFPEVLLMDSTADTNKESRPLFTITGKDSTGHMFTILRAFVPNERAWVFRWIFQTVMPALLGKDLLLRVRAVITDGDSQEISQLDDALRNYMPTAQRLRCGWHIIDRGWQRHCRSLCGRDSAIKRNLQLWMYSWMRAGTGSCETEEEYKVSKALILEYINSRHVASTIGQDACRKLETFIRLHVEPHEQHYCFFQRLAIRHMDLYSNTPHEGTNNGMKASAAPSMPQHSIATAAQVLCVNSELNTIHRGRESAALLMGHKLWSKSKTADYVTNCAENEIKNQTSQIDNYCSMRLNSSNWSVRRRQPLLHSAEVVQGTALVDANHMQSQPRVIPQFDRIRKVKLVGQCLHCSCHFFERIGLPCRHQIHVLHYHMMPLWSGLSHHDVSVRWWTAYLFFYRSVNADHVKICSTLKALDQNDCKGPLVPKNFASHLPPSYPIICQHEQNAMLPVDASFFDAKPIQDSCKNYTVDEIALAIGKRLHGWDNACIPPNMTQETSISQHWPPLHEHANIDDVDNHNFEMSNQGQEVDFAVEDRVNIHEVCAVSERGSVYQQLYPVFKELCSLLEPNTPEVQMHFTYLSKSILHEKERCLKKTQSIQLTGQFVSVSVNSNKRRRTHGTQHY
ncbi:hypothetical protein MHU86_1951 [Fragilaria crotonensis]|nr:hypothetical protein MHU86_1951 [Fragilaria crotonensis]